MAVRDEEEQSFDYVLENNKNLCPANHSQTGDIVCLVYRLAVEVMIENVRRRLRIGAQR